MSVLLAPGAALAGPGSPPILAPDTITTPEDTAATGNVLANDSNPGDGTLQVTAYGPLSPTVGTLSIDRQRRLHVHPRPELVRHGLDDVRRGE